jgi:hypothetical protein
LPNFFLGKNWEEKKIREIMEKEKTNHKIPFIARDEAILAKFSSTHNFLENFDG